MESKTIKETMEFLAGVQVLGVAVKKVSADGKVDLKDLPEVIELGKQLPVLMAAGQGLAEIPSEVKDLSMEELAEIGKKVIEIRNAIQAA